MAKKRAQAALEFLTTYGWAFLVILIMIGALGYFGILNPSRFLPERCNVNIEFDFACEEFSMQKMPDGDLLTTIVLRNAQGQAIDLDVASGDIKITGSSLDADGFVNGVDLTGANWNSNFNAVPTPGAAGGCSVGGGTGISGAPPYLTVSADERFMVQCRIDSDVAGDLAVTLPSLGSKVSVDFFMTYTPQGKSLVKPITGEVFASLQ